MTTGETPLIIYWMRRDMRLTDNRALRLALERTKAVRGQFLALTIIEDYMREGGQKVAFGAPSQHMLAHALPAISTALPGLTIVTGKAATWFISLKETLPGTPVELYVHEDVYPDFGIQLKKISQGQITVHQVRDRLTIPRETRTSTGGYYSVFTPFRRAVWDTFLNTPPDPKVSTALIKSVPHFALNAHLASHPTWSTRTQIIPATREAISALWAPTSHIWIHGARVNLSKLSLPSRDLSAWPISESDAQKEWHHARTHTLPRYHDTRNALAQSGTTRLSSALAWGLVSARTLVHDTLAHYGNIPEGSTGALEGVHTFLSELIWREFYAYLMVHHPMLLNQEFQARHRTLSWAPTDTQKERFAKWMQGETGYDIVDAAMMELAQTGWMHNRARMIVSSVLTKNLGVDWRLGQEYFRAMLIDIDEASNNGGWQWGASVGADPKPIRIFNPYTQAKNFDPEGVYRRKWLTRPLDALAPIVPHVEARTEALLRYGMRPDAMR